MMDRAGNGGKVIAMPMKNPKRRRRPIKFPRCPHSLLLILNPHKGDLSPGKLDEEDGSLRRPRASDLASGPEMQNKPPAIEAKPVATGPEKPPEPLLAPGQGKTAMMRSPQTLTTITNTGKGKIAATTTPQKKKKVDVLRARPDGRVAKHLGGPAGERVRTVRTTAVRSSWEGYIHPCATGWYSENPNGRDPDCFPLECGRKSSWRHSRPSNK